MASLTENMTRINVRASAKKSRAVVVRSVLASVKPGGSVTQARSAAWNASTLPRQIRGRATRGSPRKATRPGPASPLSPASPHQEAVQNPATGKVALGPWLGPFSPLPQQDTKKPELLPSTLYMDTRGFVHFGLTSDTHHSILAAIRAVQEPSPSETSSQGARGGALKGAGASPQALAMQAQAVKASRQAMQSQAVTKARVPLHTMGRGQMAVRQMHLINQPRRFY